jgi:nucleoside 2-deoxyribosyltransferase
MKVYLSGGMVSNWQERMIKAAPGIYFINPMDHEYGYSREYTTADLLGIRMADVVFCYIESSNPLGIGAAIECGYAKALGKTVVLVNEKYDRNYDMLAQIADVFFTEIEKGINFLCKLGEFIGETYEIR